MRLLKLLDVLTEAEFLIERDVLNAKEIKAWSKQAAERVQAPQGKTWMASQLSKFLINRYEEGLQPVTQPPPGAPDWMLAKLQAGEPIYNVVTTPELQAQVQSVTDWINVQLADNPKADLRMTWEEAVEHQAEWHDEIKRMGRVSELTPEQMEGIVTVREYKNGFHWVDVKTEICLKHEGTMMGHCVGQGGYTSGVREETTKIFSLRNKKGLAHVTIEGTGDTPIMNVADLASMSINQIKGKENSPPVAKYREYVSDFMNWGKITKFSYGGKSDLERMGLYQTTEGTYATLDELAEPVVKVDDGTEWVILHAEKLASSTSSESNTKTFLLDKKKNILGDAVLEGNEVISIVVPSAYNNNDYMKYRKHVLALFDTNIVASDRLTAGYNNPLERYALMQVGDAVGEPQIIGKLAAETSVGNVYGSPMGGGTWANVYWLMNGDQPVSLLKMRLSKDDTKIVEFDYKFGFPSTNIVEFVTSFNYQTGENAEIVMFDGNPMILSDLAKSPKGQKIFEKNGVSWFGGNVHPLWGDVYGYDQHGNKMMYLEASRNNMKIYFAKSNVEAGYHAIYLLEHLIDKDDPEDLEMDNYQDYSSFARAFLNATDWYNDGRDGWYVMDSDAPIIFTHREYTANGNQNDVEEGEATMGRWFEATGLDGIMEPDFFVDKYQDLYAGRTVSWEDEREADYGYDDEDDGENDPVTLEEYYADFNGNPTDYEHPATGGNWTP